MAAASDALTAGLERDLVGPDDFRRLSIALIGYGRD